MTGTPPRAPASATPFQREFLNILADGDPRAAARLANRLVNAGVPLSSVVLDLLAPAQVEVGRRWQVADWTVAHEHAATAATDAALAAAVLYGGSRHEFAPHGPTLVVACAEGEWHTMPSRMAAEVLTAAGLRVTLLGPSLPAAHLQTYLTMVQPTALGLSCTLPLNLPGARRCVLAAHEVGVPVIAAGRAFGAGRTSRSRCGSRLLGAAVHGDPAPPGGMAAGAACLANAGSRARRDVEARHTRPRIRTRRRR